MINHRSSCAAGSALYPQSLLDAVVADLASHAYGNPHSGGMSGSRSAAASEDVMQQAAEKVLQHLNADPAEYQVVFTRYVFCSCLIWWRKRICS